VIPMQAHYLSIKSLEQLLRTISRVKRQINPGLNISGIRPHAKLSKAVKVADTSDQGEAESKALSPVAVTLGEDTKPFDKTDGVFNKDTFS